MKLVTALCFLCCSTVALAHHGNSEYDLTTTTKYEGKVVDFVWRNPHILAKVATRTEAGEPITLEIEGASPSVLRTGGYSSKSLTTGEQVTVVVSPSKRAPKESAYGYEIIKADGSSVPLVSARMKPQLQTSQAATSVFGTWVSTADSFAKFTRTLNSWPLTDKAREIKSKFTVAQSGQVKCVPVSAPMLMMYPVVMVFEKAADHVAIKSEWLGAQRTVYTDGRKHPAQERFQQGHSIGHWEGEELVVDTTNFTDQETGGTPSGRARHLTERFTLGKDGKSMSYSYVLQDVEFLAGDVTGGAEMSYRPDMQLAGVECDQELAKRFLR